MKFPTYLFCLLGLGTFLPCPKHSDAQQTILDLKFDQLKKIPTDIKTVGQPKIDAYTKQANALFLDGSSFLRLDGTSDALKFRNDSSITFETWVAPHSVVNGQQIYIVGKGRTNRSGFPAENQNYALRLRGINGLAKASFLFRSLNRDSGKQQYNRWNSKIGFPADGNWHHIVLHYEFGKPKNVVAWIDGRKSTGDWDMGGPVVDPPVVDDDELWIGSGVGGSRTASFAGYIHHLQIHRDLKSTDQLVALANRPPPQFTLPTLDDSELDDGKVLVEVVEQVPERAPPFLISTSSTEKFKTDFLALENVPQKYARPGVITDRTPTFLVRCRIKKVFEPGEYEFRIRAKSASALMLGDRVISTLPMMKRNSSGHEPVPKLLSYKNPLHYPPPAGHQEKTFPYELKGGEQVIRFETLVGGNGLRNELGEVVVAFRKKGDHQFQILSNQKTPSYLTYKDWEPIASAYRSQLMEIEKNNRQVLAKLDAPFWDDRHQHAQSIVQKKSPKFDELSIDQLVENELRKNQLSGARITDDATFMRRVYFDIIGRPPSRRMVIRFVEDQSADKRSRLIDQLLDSPEYADHWVSYWQDVLAENPGILKPKLNNTGPFRFWIYESLLDNKPMDRFASELIGMKGSRTGGGPAGFGQATENDVPTAAKANVLSRAFLGIDLTCARCHDSPSSHFEQRDLFEMAAMLNRTPITLPKTSTVANAGTFSAVKVTLKPGEKVSPKWPFEKDLKFSAQTGTDDPRRRLAEMITSPDNDRFVEVLANRIWTRMFGAGLVDAPDDFLIGQKNHPELLQFLGNVLRANNYDAKALIRQIANSKAYQRVSSEDEKLVNHFAARKIRTLSAEQIVDSLYSISGKPMSLGEISFDPEGRRTASTFLNLGKPRRAWQLTSLANERDRPALALPRAQAVVDVLNAFGWRESRPNPITEREDTTTLVQPLVLSNGNATHRIVQLSDDSEFTTIAIESADLPAVIRSTYIQILGRSPTAEEIQTCHELLNSGFEERLVPGAEPTPVYSNQFRTAVSWSNHLHPDATKIKLQVEQAVRRGDFVTNKLQSEWRERMEDLVWALVNSPEFILVR